MELSGSPHITFSRGTNEYSLYIGYALVDFPNALKELLGPPLEMDGSFRSSYSWPNHHIHITIEVIDD